MMRMLLSVMVTMSLLSQAPQKQPAKQPLTRILALDNGTILSMGGALQFDEIGIKFVGKATIKGNDEIYDGHTFTPSPEFWEMVRRNLAEADASAHVSVKGEKLYHDGKLVNFGGLQVKWIRKPIFWQDWIIGVGLTSKSGPPRMDYLEPSELVYYNHTTLRGGAIMLGGKGAASDPRILTQ